MKKFILILITLVLISAELFAVNDISTVNAIDRVFAKEYSEGMDKVGTALQFLTMATPAVLFTEDSDQYARIGAMYVETIGVTYVAKEIAKKMIPRDRPYTYYEGAPAAEADDWNKSFPSGHTALAFAGATFTSYVFHKYNPESEWKIPVVATSYALATATAVMRVASGNHFVTDVLAGAALGAACGFAVPYLHTLIGRDDVTLDVSPFHTLLSIKF